MSIQNLLLAILAVSVAALAAQPFWPDLQSARTMKLRAFVGGS